MASGPQHYTEGEKWLLRAKEHHHKAGTHGPDHDAKATSAALIASAHFAAAQAAATMDATRINPEGWTDVLDTDNT